MWKGEEDESEMGSEFGEGGEYDDDSDEDSEEGEEASSFPVFIILEISFPLRFFYCVLVSAVLVSFACVCFFLVFPHPFMYKCLVLC